MLRIAIATVNAKEPLQRTVIPVSYTHLDVYKRQEQMKQDVPSFRPGDTVEVKVWVVEGSKKRLQADVYKRQQLFFAERAANHDIGFDAHHAH